MDIDETRTDRDIFRFEQDGSIQELLLDDDDDDDVHVSGEHLAQALPEAWAQAPQAQAQALPETQPEAHAEALAEAQPEPEQPISPIKDTSMLPEPGFFDTELPQLYTIEDARRRILINKIKQQKKTLGSLALLEDSYIEKCPQETLVDIHKMLENEMQVHLALTMVKDGMIATSRMVESLFNGQR